MSQQLLPDRRSSGGTERWEPVSELEQMSERMRRLLDQTFGGFAPASMLAEVGSWTPLVDIEEQDDAYLIEADLPGVKRKDVNIELVGNELIVTGEIKERERKGIARWRTRKVGRFEFRVTLPQGVDGDKIDAKLDDGVLTVRVPKSERAERRQIQVQEA